VSNYFSRIQGQHAKESIFNRREMNLRVGNLYRTTDKINAERAGQKFRCFMSWIGAAQDGAQPRQQFGRIERFGNVIIGPSVECGYFILGTIPHTGDQHGNPAPFANAAQDIDTIQIRQAKIQDNDIRPAERRFRNSKLAFVRSATR